MSARFTRAASRRLAEAAVLGRLAGRRRRRLARVLERSEPDRRAYHALSEAFRVLEGEPVLAQAQRARVLDAILAGLSPPSPGAPRALLVRRWPLALAAGIVVAVSALIVAPAARRPGSADSELQARGASAPTVSARGRVGIKAFCVRGGQVVEPPRAGGPAARCRVDDELQLVATHTAGFSHLLVIGHQARPDAAALWYYPVPPSGESGPAPQGVLDEPLGQAIRISVNHRPGPLRILAVFSRAPVDAASAQAWLGALGPDESLAGLWPRLRGSETASEVTLGELRVMIEGPP